LLLVGLVSAGPSLRPGPVVLSGADIYRQALPAVAWVHAADRGKGTGFVIDRSRRWLVTGYHVVGENATVDVFFPVFRQGVLVTERSFYFENVTGLQKSRHVVQGKVLRRERDTDLALVELDALPVGTGELPLAADSPAAGEQVHGLGNRYDSAALWAYGRGVVRQVRTLREGYFSGGQQLGKGARVVMAQAPINEGDSGGPLLNSRGEVVGVAAAVAWETQGAGLFIDVAEVRGLLARVRGQPSNTADRPPIASLGRDVYQQGLPSLALVKTTGSDRHSSGVVFDRSRKLVVTTAEAVGRKETVEVLFPVSRSGKLIADAVYYRDNQGALREQHALTMGVVLATDLRRNLALLEVTGFPDNAAPPNMAAELPLPGDSLHALGSPIRLESLWLYSAGCLRQRGLANLGQTMDSPDPEVLLVQMPLNDGEGGGPLLNDRGELVGVVTGRAAPQQLISYALTLAELRAFVAENQARWNPMTAADLCARGILFRKARQYERAIVDFSAALDVDARSALACSERAQAYQERGDLAQALADCNRAIRLDARLPLAYSRRAAILSQLGRQKDAIADCDTALRLDTDHAAAFSTRGEARRLLGDLKHALADCDQAIWLDRKSALAYLYRGKIHAQQDDADKALADYNRALVLDPLLADVYRCRADLYWSRSNVQAALADYEQAVQLNSFDVLSWYGWARIGVVRLQEGLKQVR
jgi:S1-C subfamily serine protease/Tfp pilus assembly protein PilF